MTEASAQLLAETAWLARLAAELVPAADRDDLVQDVLTRALHLPEPPRQPRAWLATVARNRAIRLRQRDLHRRQREQAVARAEASVPAADELAAGFALHRTIVNAVAELDEPYRTALLLRFWDGLPPRKVAQRLQVPVETARTRIKRGVDRLRQRLDERAGGRRAWVAALLQIDPAAAVLTANATIPTLLLTVLTMKKTLLAAAVAVLALAFVLPQLRGTAANAAPPLPATEAAQAADAVAAATPPTAPVEPAAERSPVATVQTGSLLAEVRYADDSPAADIEVTAIVAGTTAAAPSLRTDANGRAQFGDLPPGSVTVVLDRGARREVQLEPGAHANCAFVLARGVDVRGTVQTLDRQPVAGARICALAIDHPELLPTLGATGDDGTFVLRDVPPGTLLIARKDGWQPSRGRGVEVRGQPGATVEVAIELGARAFALRGRVLDGTGQPAPYARIVIAVDEDCRKRIDGLADLRAADGNGKLDREAMPLRADAAGEFTTREVPWGDAAVFARGVGALDTSVGCASARVRPGVTNEVTVHLAEGAEVFGTVRDQDGTPYGGMVLHLEHDGCAAIGEIDADRLGHDAIDRRVRVAADGTYRCRGVWPANYDVRRELAHQSERLGKVEPVAGERRQLDLVVARTWQLRVAVHDAVGAPRAGWAVMLSSDATIAFAKASRSVTDADGTFTAADLVADELWLTVHAPAADADEPWHRLPSFVQRVRRGTDAVVATVAPPAASLQARVLGSDGAPRPAATLELQLDGSRERLRAKSGADGRVEFAALPAGDYSLAVRADGPPLQRTVHLGAGQQLDLGDLLLPVAAQLEVEVRVDGVAAPDATEVKLLQAKPGGAPEPTEWTEVATLRRRDGVHRSAGLLPGSYLVQVRCPECAPELRAVDLTATAPTRLRVECTKGVQQEFVLTLSDPTAVSRNNGYAWLTILDGEGRPLVEHYATGKVTDAARPDLSFRLHLRPGTYTARARGRTGAAEATIAVAAGNPPIRLVLQ